MKTQIKIFDLNYLLNEDYTDDDLYHLFTTKSLIYSLIVAQFKLGGYKKTYKEIKSIVKKKNWQYNYFLNSKQMKDFENDLIKIFIKLYQCSHSEAVVRTQMFYIQYGFNNKCLEHDKNITYLDE